MAMWAITACEKRYYPLEFDHEGGFEMLRSFLVTTAALTLLATSTWAATVPTLSGKYSVASSDICQAVESSADPGSIKSQSLIANFDSSTGMVKAAGTTTEGDLVVWTGGTAGLTQSSGSSNTTYSNTATTFTIDGVAFAVTYGPVKGGVAQSMQWSGITGGGCARTATGIRQ